MEVKQKKPETKKALERRAKKLLNEIYFSQYGFYPYEGSPQLNPNDTAGHR